MHIYPIHSCGELSVEDLSALKYLHTGDPAAAAAAKASALETSFGKWVLYCFIDTLCGFKQENEGFTHINL